jgi:hypothetical protein
MPGPQSENLNSTGIQLDDLISYLVYATAQAQQQIENVRNNAESTSIGDMLKMQMLMNTLSQAGEMVTAVLSASHATIKSMAQNVR